MSKARQRCIRSHGVRLPGISLGFQRRDCGGTGGQSVAEFFDLIFRVYGPLDLSLSPVYGAELAHGIFRARTPAPAQRRRLYIEEVPELVPTHPMTSRTGWLVGQIEGQEAAKGNVLPFNNLSITAAALEQDYAVLTEILGHFG